MSTARTSTARTSTARTPGTWTETSASLAQVNSTDRICRTVVLDQPIAQPWAGAAAPSVDSVRAAPHEWIASAELRASMVVADSAAVESAVVVAVDSVAAADGVRAATQWRMK